MADSAPDWYDVPRSLAGRALTGTGAFRLMPQDAMAEAEASGSFAVLAAGWAACLTYRWRHPEDGDQEGVLLIASPEDDGTVQATLVDSWHQKPEPMHLSGAREGARTSLHATYGETWGWNVLVDLTTDSVRLVMQNVVSEEAQATAAEGDEVEAGAYDVMDLRLRGAG